jgi:hypothetical protein
MREIDWKSLGAFVGWVAAYVMAVMGYRRLSRSHKKAVADPTANTAGYENVMAGLKVGLYSVGALLIGLALAGLFGALQTGGHLVERSGGRVVGYKSFTTARSDSSHKDVHSFPVVEFVDDKGAAHRFESRLNVQLEDESNVAVVYPEGEQEKAEIKHFFAQRGWMIICGGLGLACLILGWGAGLGL